MHLQYIGHYVAAVLTSAEKEKKCKYLSASDLQYITLHPLLFVLMDYLGMKH